MTCLEMAMLVTLGLLAGLLIGAAGIGGVIIVPSLIYFAGVPVQAAIAGAMLCYLVTGFIGTLVYARAKSIAWGMTRWLWAGSMPAALGGALLVDVAPPLLLEALIGSLTVFSGLNGLISRSGDCPSPPALPNLALCVIGAVTGFLSAISGTGGPLVLVPILLFLELPVLTAVGLSQAIQLPIALLATAGNLASGNVDLLLGGLLAAGLACGTWIGARSAHALPRAALRRMVSAVLVIVGALILIGLAVRPITSTAGSLDGV